MFLKRYFSGTRFRNIWIIIRLIFCCLLYLDTPFPKNFQSVVKNIFKRLFRVFVHVYIHHFEKIVNLGAVSFLTVLCLILYALQFSCVAHSFKLFNDMKSFFEIFQCVLNFLLFFFLKILIHFRSLLTPLSFVASITKICLKLVLRNLAFPFILLIQIRMFFVWSDSPP